MTVNRIGIRMFVRVVVCLAFAAIASAADHREDGPTDADSLTFFEKQVRPILEQKCFKCHGAESKVEGGLRLTNRSGVLAGGDSGEAVSLDSPADSLLIEAINYASFEMPPTGKLAANQIEVLTRWVEMGIPWTPGFDATARGDVKHGPPPVNDETKSFWSFQPVTRPEPPTVRNAEWVRNPIDAFILASLENANLTPASKAAKSDLLRRAYYDLIGLPPTPEEVAAFLADESPDAFANVVDRLLDSPHYGERWGRHWLDLVRYAETNSYERDDAKPFVWRYRDYVIASFNDDKPYDQFVREQLAGDEMRPRNSEGLIATGYYRLGIWDDEPADPEQALYDDLDDILMTTSQVFLGMTINCARCHDHKLDPIPQHDYYRMLSFFAGLNRYGIRGQDTVERFSLRSIATEEELNQQAAAIDDHERIASEVDRKIADLEKLVVEDFEPVEVEEFKHEMNKIALVQKRVGRTISKEQFDRYVELRKRQKQLSQFKPPAMSEALCVTEIGKIPRETFVLGRGNPHSKGDRVEPGFLSVLSPPEPTLSAVSDLESSGRRTALAQWIASPENPLTARVIANRIWQYHFGRGIVRSSNDFGFQGTPPTHPELLDWLAAELIDGGWRMKRLHKLIMTSSTYQMSSQANDAALAADPQNDHFWRFDMRRLEAEEIRDSILAVNGSLNPKMSGPSIYPIMPAEVLAGQSRPGAGWGNSSPDERNRRSIYIHLKRSLITPILADFDVADADSTCPVRFATTQPTQALGMINSDFLNEEARVFARFLRQHAGDRVRDQVATALRRAWQREPNESEIEQGSALIESLRTKHGHTADEALDYFCLVVLNTNEFIFLD